MVPIDSQCKHLTNKTFEHLSLQFSKKVILSRIKASIVQESIKRKIISDTFKTYKTKFIKAALNDTREKMKLEVSKLFNAFKTKLLTKIYNRLSSSELASLSNKLIVKRSKAQHVKSEIYK
jgi:hypothetical protein